VEDGRCRNESPKLWLEMLSSAQQGCRTFGKMKDLCSSRAAVEFQARDSFGAEE